MLKAFIVGVLLSLGLAGVAAAQNCPAYPYTLTNGVTADATQVMADLNTVLNCANSHTTNPVFTGNVGIDNAAPITAIDVNGAAHFSGNCSNNISSQGAYISWNRLSCGTGETDFINNPGFGNGGFAFMLGNPGGTSINTAMFINGSGNVGIGTTNPSANLAVSGQILQLGAGLNLASSDSNLIFGDWPNPTGWQQLFFNHNVQMFEFSSGLITNGWTGINDVPDAMFSVAVGTPPTSGDFSYLASFYTAYDSWQSVLIARSGVSNPQELAFGVNQGSHYSEIQATQGLVGVNELVLNRQGGPTSIGLTGGGYSLNVGGTVFAYGGAGALSDVRDKDQIAALPAGAISLVQQLRPVTFVWRKPKDDGMQGQQMGFIAQEVEKVLPSAVLTGKDAKKTKGLKYNELVAVLTKAVQEQEAEIQALKQQVAALKPSSSQ